MINRKINRWHKKSSRTQSRYVLAQKTHCVIEITYILSLWIKTKTARLWFWLAITLNSLIVSFSKKTDMHSGMCSAEISNLLVLWLTLLNKLLSKFKIQSNVEIYTRLEVTSNPRLMMFDKYGRIYPLTRQSFGRWILNTVQHIVTWNYLQYHLLTILLSYN